MTGRKKRGRGTKNTPLLLIALPGLAYLLINNYIPMFGIFLAFKSYDFSKGAFGSPWCGFDNFKFVLKTLGMDPVSWYTKSNIWPFILILVFLWQTVGHTSIIYMASIAGIDKGIYEAAKIDGAGKIKQIFYITLPLLKPTITIMGLMAIGKIFFSDFGLFYQVPMNSGALYGVTQTIDTFVYRGLMELNDVGMSSAAGLFQSCVGFILVITANALVRKMNPENALF